MLRHTVIRRQLSIAVLVVLVLVAGACSSSGDGDSVTESVASSGDGTTTTTAEEPDTRTIEHALGTSQVPADPERVVVVDRRGTLAFALELGIEPVGAVDASFLFGTPFHPLVMDEAEAAGVAPLDATDGPPLEQIAALQPDLIIGNVRDMGETTEELAAIAPTVGLEWNFEDPMANAVTIAEVFGLEDEAQDLVTALDTAVDDAAADTPDPGTVSIIGLFAIDDIRIYRSANMYGRLTSALGGEIVPTEAELPLDPADGEVNNVSLEQIGMASGDRIISLVNLAAEEDASYRALVDEPLVQALPAFQSGQVLEADPQLAFGAAGSIGLRAMLDQLAAFYRG